MRAPEPTPPEPAPAAPKARAVSRAEPRRAGPSGSNRDPRPAEGPWARLAEAFRALGPPAATLAEGRPTLDRGTLTLALPGGRPLADGRRALRSPAVREAVDRCYSTNTLIEVVPLPDTGSDRDRQDALERQVLADPAMQRILAALDAQLHRVVPFTDGE